MLETPKPQLQVRHEIPLICCVLSFTLLLQPPQKTSEESGRQEPTAHFRPHMESSSIYEIFPFATFNTYLVRAAAG